MPKHTTLRKNKIQKRNIEGIDWIQWIESEDFQRQAPATGITMDDLVVFTHYRHVATES